MDVSRPYLAVMSPAEGAALQVLLRTNAPMTGRQIARLARDGSQPTIQAVLNRFHEHGLVSAQPVGTAILYTLNRHHVTLPALSALMGAREQVIQSVREAVRDWKPGPAHLSIFGSMARGDGNTSSDIDLFIVRPARAGPEAPTWRRQVSDLEKHLQTSTGNHVTPIEVSLDLLARLKAERSKILREVQRDAIVIAGRHLSDLLEGLQPRRRSSAEAVA